MAKRSLFIFFFGFIVFAVLHNVFHGVAGEVEGVRTLVLPLQVLSVATFLLATFLPGSSAVQIDWMPDLGVRP